MRQASDGLITEQVIQDTMKRIRNVECARKLLHSMRRSEPHLHAMAKGSMRAIRGRMKSTGAPADAVEQVAYVLTLFTARLCGALKLADSRFHTPRVRTDHR